MKLSRKQKLRVLQFEFTAICFKIRVRELNANFATENTKGRKSNSNEANYSWNSCPSPSNPTSGQNSTKNQGIVSSVSYQLNWLVLLQLIWKGMLETVALRKSQLTQI